MAAGLLRILWRLVKYGVLALVLLVVALMSPVGYIELMCHKPISKPDFKPLVTDIEYQRATANTFLTYPEWHIVYAYDGLAEVLKTEDEHEFDYSDSVTGFWSATCAMMGAADEHGGADQATRVMIHTIGVSFTLEMGLKAAYEETIGHLTAWLRGPVKTPQDELVATMSTDYAAFLRQTPWYKYDFASQADKLAATPVTNWLRSHERKLAIGLEWRGKVAYAGAIASAVAATGQAQLTIRSVVSGVDEAALAAWPDIVVIANRDGMIEMETPRYARFTDILTGLAAKGATIHDIAGNDVIMVSLIVPSREAPPALTGPALTRIARTGFADDRLLVTVPVDKLAALLNGESAGAYTIEHVYDY